MPAKADSRLACLEIFLTVMGFFYTARIIHRGRRQTKKAGTVYLKWPVFPFYVSSFGIPAAGAGIVFFAWSCRVIAKNPFDFSGYAGLFLFAGMILALFSWNCLLGAEGVVIGDVFLRWDCVKKVEVLSRGKRIDVVFTWIPEPKIRLKHRYRIRVPASKLFVLCRIVRQINAAKSR